MKPIIVFVSFLIALTGLSIESAGVVALANALFGFGFAAVDGFGVRRGKVNPLSFAALASGLAGLANYFMVGRATAGNSDYIGYGMPQWYLHAAFLNYVGGVFVQAGGWICGLVRAGKGHGILPAVWFAPVRATVVPWTVLWLGAAGLLFMKSGLIPEIGRVSAILMQLPVTAVFVATRWGYGRNQPVVIWCAFVLAAMASFDALLYEYLRGMVLIPWLAFALGGVLGSPRGRTFASSPFVLLYVASAIFFAYFGIMGVVRSEGVYGSKRIARYVEIGKEVSRAGSGAELQSPVTRQATVSKQSRIFDLVSEKGFYGGESLEYYTYVFIPRFLWPDKPMIQKGGWFAQQLGLARDLGDRTFSNAINMTVPGELYLNFGWAGVVVGCAVMGFVLLLIWRAACFWDSDCNITGSLLAFQLIYRGICDLGPDLQSLVGYINTYLVLWALSALLRSVLPRSVIISRPVTQCAGSTGGGPMPQESPVGVARTAN